MLRWDADREVFNDPRKLSDFAVCLGGGGETAGIWASTGEGAVGGKGRGNVGGLCNMGGMSVFLRNGDFKGEGGTAVN